MTPGSIRIKRVMLILFGRFLISSGSISYMSTQRNIAFNRIRYNFSTTWFTCEMFSWKTSKSRPYVIGINLGEYEIYPCSRDLLTFIGNLFTASIR